MQADDMEACQKRVSRGQEQRQSKEVMQKIHEIHKMRALGEVPRIDFYTVLQE